MGSNLDALHPTQVRWPRWTAQIGGVEASGVGLLLHCSQGCSIIYMPTMVDLSELTAAADAHRCSMNLTYAEVLADEVDQVEVAE